MGTNQQTPPYQSILKAELAIINNDERGKEAVEQNKGQSVLLLLVLVGGLLLVLVRTPLDQQHIVKDTNDQQSLTCTVVILAGFNFDYTILSFGVGGVYASAKRSRSHPPCVCLSECECVCPVRCTDTWATCCLTFGKIAAYGMYLLVGFACADLHAGIGWQKQGVG